MPDYVPPAHLHPRLAKRLPDGRSLGDILAFVNNGFVVDDKHLLAGRPDIITIDLLPEAASQPKIIPCGFIMHTVASSTKASNAVVRSVMQRPGFDNEPHIVGPEMVGGRLIQAMPFNVRADSNYHGNLFMVGDKTYGYLSAETQDEGDKTLAKTPWSLEQLNISAGFITATAATYRFPCTIPAEPQSGGVTYHAQYPTVWSKSGHDCPRAARIAQMPYLWNQVAERLANFYGAIGESCPSGLPK